MLSRTRAAAYAWEVYWTTFFITCESRNSNNVAKTKIALWAVSLLQSIRDARVVQLPSQLALALNLFYSLMKPFDWLEWSGWLACLYSVVQYTSEGMCYPGYVTQASGYVQIDCGRTFECFHAICDWLIDQTRWLTEMIKLVSLL